VSIDGVEIFLVQLSNKIVGIDSPSFFTAKRLRTTDLFETIFLGSPKIQFWIHCSFCYF